MTDTKGMHPITTEDGDEVLTLREVARILKAGTKQIYELTRTADKNAAESRCPCSLFTAK